MNGLMFARDTSGPREGATRADMAARPEAAALPSRRIFDCFLFNGEMDVLTIRLHELSDVVDCFVVVESDTTFSGMQRDIRFDPRDPRVAPFAARLRHVVVRDMPATDNAWEREAWQRNAMLRGVPDAADDDLIMLSDVDEIPRASDVMLMAADRDHDVFGYRLVFSYFYVNYRNVGGPETAVICNIAATPRVLQEVCPNDLRYAVRDGRRPARIFEPGGWHFSYLMDDEGVRRKLAAFSHQEYNTLEFLRRIDIRNTVRRGGDLFNRPGFEWQVLADPDLPAWLRQHRRQLPQLFYPGGIVQQVSQAFAGLVSRPRRAPRKSAPVVICPYLHDHEDREISNRFHLTEPAMRRVRFHLWHDEAALGPERAFQHCWEMFPEHDVIIVHSDMAPLPGRPVSEWYDALVAYRDSLPAAGMIACNLLRPQPTPSGAISVQCAGGIMRDGKIDWLHGGTDEPDGVPLAQLQQVRTVDWVTFGGVLIRREVLRACGMLDEQYEWAYVMDVDYSFTARLRGFQLVQVPVALHHEESRTTRAQWEKDPGLLAKLARNHERFYAKWRPFFPALGYGASLAAS